MGSNLRDLHESFLTSWQQACRKIHITCLLRSSQAVNCWLLGLNFFLAYCNEAAGANPDWDAICFLPTEGAESLVSKEVLACFPLAGPRWTGYYNRELLRLLLITHNWRGNFRPQRHRTPCVLFSSYRRPICMSWLLIIRGDKCILPGKHVALAHPFSLYLIPIRVFESVIMTSSF